MTHPTHDVQGRKLFPCPIEGCPSFPWFAQAGVDHHLATFDHAAAAAAGGFRSWGPASAPTAPVAEGRRTTTATTGSGKFETVANGFGGTTSRRVTATPAPGSSRTASEASLRFLRKLLDEKAGHADCEVVRADLNAARQAGELTQGLVSASINKLKALPKSSAPAPKREQREPVADGFYLRDGVVWKVQTSQTGNRYAKRLVPPTPEQLAADPKAKGEWEYEGGRMTRVLTEDDVLTLEKGKEYGALYSICCVCGATLRAEESIEAGIGPVCGGRLA